MNLSSSSFHQNYYEPTTEIEIKGEMEKSGWKSSIYFLVVALKDDVECWVKYKSC